MNKTVLKRIEAMILATTVVLTFFGFVNFSMVNDVDSNSRVTFHDYYNKDNIDLLFVGPSHVYCDIDSNYIESETELKCFSLGTNSQAPISSYYLIKEAIQDRKIKNIYYELSYDVLQNNCYTTKTIFAVSDYIRNPLIKLQLLYNIERKIGNYFVLGLFPFKRDTANLNIVNNIKEKSSKTYKNYKQYSRDIDTEYFYLGNGFYRTPVFNSLNCSMVMDDSYNSASMNENLFWISKIIELCKENDVNLIFVTLPAIDLKSILISDNISDYVDNLLQSNGIEYINFNLLSKKDLGIEDSIDFYDDDHLNVNGARKVSKAIADNINGLTVNCKKYKSNKDIINSEGYPYGVYYQMYTNDNPNVIGYKVSPYVYQANDLNVSITIEDINENNIYDILEANCSNLEDITVEIDSKIENKFLVVNIHDNKSQKDYKSKIYLQ